MKQLFIYLASKSLGILRHCLVIALLRIRKRQKTIPKSADKHDSLTNNNTKEE